VKPTPGGIKAPIKQEEDFEYKPQVAALKQGNNIRGILAGDDDEDEDDKPFVMPGQKPVTRLPPPVLGGPSNAPRAPLPGFFGGGNDSDEEDTGFGLRASQTAAPPLPRLGVPARLPPPVPAKKQFVEKFADSDEDEDT
jgi:hypothetical protein